MIKIPVSIFVVVFFMFSFVNISFIISLISWLVFCIAFFGVHLWFAPFLTCLYRSMYCWVSSSICFSISVVFSVRL